MTSNVKDRYSMYGIISFRASRKEWPIKEASNRSLSLLTLKLAYRTSKPKIPNKEKANLSYTIKPHHHN